MAKDPKPEPLEDEDKPLEVILEAKEFGTRLRNKKSNRKCSVPGCSEPHCAKGRCQLHYMREIHAARKREAKLNDSDSWLQRSALDVARDAYKSAVTVDARLKWRREIAELEETEDELQEQRARERER